MQKSVYFCQDVVDNNLSNEIKVKAMTKVERDFLNWLNSQLDVKMDSEEEVVAIKQIHNPAIQKFGASIPNMILAYIKDNRTWHPLQGD